MARRVNIEPLRETPEPHTWLSVNGRKHFREIMPLLVKEGVVRRKDVWLVESACECFAIFQDDSKPFTTRKAALQQYQAIMSNYGVTYKASRQLDLLDHQESKADEDDENTYGGLFG